MNIKQGARTIELRPQGFTRGRKLIFAGAEMYSKSGDYIGFWYPSNMPVDLKRELIAELSANWLPHTYDRDTLHGKSGR